MGELTWLQDKTVFYRYAFVQCLAQMARVEMPVNMAIAEADKLAIAAANHVFSQTVYREVKPNHEYSD